jgi:hypothetical protein
MRIVPLSSVPLPMRLTTPILRVHFWLSRQCKVAERLRRVSYTNRGLIGSRRQCKSPVAMRARCFVIPYAVRSFVWLFKRNLPNTMYSPIATNGIPQSLKKTGPPLLRTADSQKNANAAHIMLNGIRYASAPVKRTAGSGRPVHRRSSPDLRYGESWADGLLPADDAGYMDTRRVYVEKCAPLATRASHWINRQ